MDQIWNTQPNGGGYNALVPYQDAIMSGRGANFQQQQHTVHQTNMAIVNGTGHYPLVFQHECTCHGYGGAVHSLQCEQYNYQRYVNLVRQQPPPPPPQYDQTHAPSGADQVRVSLRPDPDHEMKDMSGNSCNSNGGSPIEEVERQSTSGVAEDTQPLVPPGGTTAPESSTAQTHHEEHDQQGSDASRDTRSESEEVSNPDEFYSFIHGCCNTPCQFKGQYYSAQGSIPAPSPRHSERKTGNILGNIVKSGLRTIGLGADSEQHDTEKLQNRDAHVGSLKKEKEDLQRRINDLEKSNREALKKKDEELRLASDDRQSRMSNLRAELQEATASITRYQTAAKAQDSQIVNLTMKMNEYKALAERLGDQISSMEQSNSKAVAGTGAHKDSHAIPPNLLKSLFVVKEAAFAFTKTFILFLKERNALENHVALQNLPVDADERYRKHAMEAYITRRLFAGFENDCYVDSLDELQGSQYLPSDYEEHDFFLRHQDVEVRQQRYLAEYDNALELGLQGYMDRFKTKKLVASRNPFHRFCSRKLVNIMEGVDGFSKEYPPYADYSEHSLLYQLATNPKLCDQFLKPFVNLSISAYLLHRLAFQFNPPARIIRYARGTKFDRTYMENAFPIDDDVSTEELVVALMLSPGFQVGATIAKSKVYLVQVQVQGSDRAK